MNEASTFGRYLFWLALFLIGVAYFAGFVADTGALKDAINSLGLTFTGRNAQGNFASYPGGASTSAIASTATLAQPHPTSAPV
jgi:hypothetical protein